MVSDILLMAGGKKRQDHTGHKVETMNEQAFQF